MEHISVDSKYLKNFDIADEGRGGVFHISYSVFKCMKEVDNSGKYTIAQNYVDYIARVLNLFTPVTAVAFDKKLNKYKVSFNKSLHGKEKEIVEYTETLLQSLKASSVPDHIDKKLVVISLLYGKWFRRHLRIICGKYSDSIKSKIPQHPEKEVSKYFSNNHSMSFIELINDEDKVQELYDEYIKFIDILENQADSTTGRPDLLKDLRFIAKRPLEDVDKVVSHLKSLPADANFENVGNEEELHAETNLAKNHGLDKGSYIGVSMLCCAICHFNLRDLGYHYAGTHGRAYAGKDFVSEASITTPQKMKGACVPAAVELVKEIQNAWPPQPAKPVQSHKISPAKRKQPSARTQRLDSQNRKRRSKKMWREGWSEEDQISVEKLETIATLSTE